MVRHILGLLFLGFCSVFGYLIQTSPNKVQIFFNENTYSVNFYVAALITFIISYIVFKVLRLIYIIWRSPYLLSRNSIERKKYNAEKLLRKGLEDMISGHYSQAEKHLVKGGELAKKLGLPIVIYYENAAIAADKQSAYERRDSYLLEARKDVGKTTATLLNEAELAVNNKDYAIAEKLLIELLSRDSNNIKTISLLDESLVAQNKWESAWKHLPKLQGNLPANKYNEKRKTYLISLFKTFSENNNFEEMELTWNKLPNSLKNDSAIVLQYAESAILLNKDDIVEPLLLNQIKNNKDLGLIQAYSQLTRANYTQQLENILSWEKEFPEDPIFLLAKATVALKAKELNIALETIEKVIQIAPTPSAFIVWAQILEALGRGEAALVAYRQGLAPQQAINGALLPPITDE